MIIKRCQLGDKDAFRQLFLSVEKKALRTAYYICGNKNTAEDIVQETYMKCFTEIKKLKSPEAFHVWFYRILVHTGWRITKKNSNLIPIEISSASEGLFIDSFKNQKNEITQCEVKYDVKEAVNSLSENLRTVVILYYLNDFSVEEIAKVTGCLKATVKSRLFYARNSLKKKLFYYNENELKQDHKSCEGV